METDLGLSGVLREFARTLVTDFPIQGILDHLVHRIVEILPISAAGVTLISPGTSPRFMSASDESASRFEALQTELGEGPCIAAYQTGEAVAIPDLAEDQRFPAFAERARAEGLVAVFTFPLCHGDHRLGALDLYRTSAGALDAQAMAAAQTLADVASAYLWNARTRAELQESSGRAVHSSLHDPLTGLANRSLLGELLAGAILRCRRDQDLLGILYIDLDRFKAVNDSFGHYIGDQLLVAVAERLTGLLRPGDTLARLAGDEFVVLCERLSDTSQVEPIAARIGLALAEPFTVSSIEVRITASVGIAFAGRGDVVPEQVLEDADAAMYQAKNRGGARHTVLDSVEQTSTKRRIGLIRDLSGATGRGELRVEYQPIVSLTTGRISSFEALLRWAHPTQGRIGPDVLVPLAEQSGLITEIGAWVLHRACLDRQAWKGHGDRADTHVSVNVSTWQLMAPDLTGTVAELVSRTGTDPSLVTLDVTESVFTSDSEVLSVLEELHEVGFRIALDGFGTGYSSLSYLERFPVDVVKIDQNFVRDLLTKPARGLILDAIVGLAHGLDMTVVAEGVETESQYDAVAGHGCESYQGFYFAPATPAGRISALLAGRDIWVPAPVGPTRASIRGS